MAKTFIFLLLSLREKCPYSEFFWSVIPRIRTEYGEIRCISAYLVRMRENADQKSSEYGHFRQCLFPHMHIFFSYLTKGFLVFSGGIKWEHWPKNELMTRKNRNIILNPLATNVSVTVFPRK